MARLQVNGTDMSCGVRMLVNVNQEIRYNREVYPLLNPYERLMFWVGHYVYGDGNPKGVSGAAFVLFSDLAGKDSEGHHLANYIQEGEHIFGQISESPVNENTQTNNYIKIWTLTVDNPAYSHWYRETLDTYKD